MGDCGRWLFSALSAMKGSCLRFGLFPFRYLSPPSFLPTHPPVTSSSGSRTTPRASFSRRSGARSSSARSRSTRCSSSRPTSCPDRSSTCPPSSSRRKLSRQAVASPRTPCGGRVWGLCVPPVCGCVCHLRRSVNTRFSFVAAPSPPHLPAFLLGAELQAGSDVHGRPVVVQGPARHCLGHYPQRCATLDVWWM